MIWTQYSIRPKGLLEMTFRVAVVAAFIACNSVGGQYLECLICGAGKTVTKPKELLPLGSPPYPQCGDVQLAGLNGEFSALQCSQLQSVLSGGAFCGCAPGTLPPSAGSPFAPVVTPVAPLSEPTDQPSKKPTPLRSPRPTKKPTGRRTPQPTKKPTGRRTSQPTKKPTGRRTPQPTKKPTGRQTPQPSK